MESPRYESTKYAICSNVKKEIPKGNIILFIYNEVLETMKEISKSGELETLPKERLWKETEKAIHEKSPHIYFMTLLEVSALDEKQFKPEDFASLEKINNDILLTKSRWASLLLNDDLDMVNLENKLGVPKKVNEFSSVCKDIFNFYKGEFSENSLMNLILKTDGLIIIVNTPH